MDANIGDPELINELNEISVQLANGIKLMGKYGREKAQSEHDYKVAVRQEAFKMRANGDAVTMIGLAVKGAPEVAKKRLQRDVSESMYETAKENINVLKLRARLLEAQIDREWRG